MKSGAEIKNDAVFRLPQQSEVNIFHSVADGEDQFLIAPFLKVNSKISLYGNIHVATENEVSSFFQNLVFTEMDENCKDFE